MQPTADGARRVRVCFVCTGNICRSPTAEVVLIAAAEQRGTADRVVVGSAGTGGWHVGDDMDRRSRATLAAAGYGPPRHRARQFTAADFADWDVVVALDDGHRRELLDLADEADDPASARASVVLLRSYDPQLRPGESPEVGDPYYGGAAGFTDVLAQIERSVDALLSDLLGRSGSDQHDDNLSL